VDASGRRWEVRPRHCGWQGWTVKRFNPYTSGRKDAPAAHGIAHLPEFHAAAGSEPHARSAAIPLKGFNRSTVEPVPRNDSAVAMDSFCWQRLEGRPPRIRAHQRVCKRRGEPASFYAATR
jgi:hypothetical protein